MLKTNLKIITILTVIIMLFSIPLSYAENETTDASLTAQPAETPEGTLVSEDPQATTGETPTEQPAEEQKNEENPSNEDEKLKKNDVYLMGDSINIDYIVDGNLFVIANDVTINTQIGGDVFVCAKSVTITENGYIFSNLFAATNTLNIRGSIYDLYTTAKDVTISGIVYRDIRVASNNLNIYGTVQRNAYVSSNNINFTNTITNEDNTVSSSTGIIAGNLNYSSKEEFKFPEGTVVGKINFEQENETNNNKGFKDYFISLITLICTVLIVWLLLTWLAPKFLQKSSELLKTKTIPVILTGVLAPIITTLVIVLLLILGITSKVGIILLAMMLALLLLSSSVTIISITSIISEKLKDKIKIENKLQKALCLIVISVIYWIISLIPYVGAIISLLVSIIGMGIIIYSILFNKCKEKEEKK